MQKAKKRLAEDKDAVRQDLHSQASLNRISRLQEANLQVGGCWSRSYHVVPDCSTQRTGLSGVVVPTWYRTVVLREAVVMHANTIINLRCVALRV